MGTATKGLCTDRGRDKGSLVGVGVGGLSKYQRELVRDLAYGGVRIPAAWLSPAEEALIPLDEDCVLDGGQARACVGLVQRLVDLCGVVIPGVIEWDIVRRRRVGVRPVRAEAETLRRGRGPRAVRDLLFAELAGWPEGIPDQMPDRLRDLVVRTLDDVLAECAASRSAPSRVHEIEGQLVEACREVIGEFAVARRLGRHAVGWLLSEVVDQLYRNAAEGRLPDNVRAWTLATARAKWRYRRSVRVEPSAGQWPVPGQDVLAEVAARVDVQRVLRDAGLHLDARAVLLTRVGEHLNAAAYEVAAWFALGGDLELVLDVVEGTDEGTTVLEGELLRRGLELGPARARAVRRIITEALRDAWLRAQAQGREASS